MNRQMGVPKFYRWLSGATVLNHVNAGTVPIIDNLYLDMNGVIHNCSHGAGTDANTRHVGMRWCATIAPDRSLRVPPFRPPFPPTPNADRDPTRLVRSQMSKVFAYLDHIFRMVRPRRLLYMAIDGVLARR